MLGQTYDKTPKAKSAFVNPFAKPTKTAEPQKKPPGTSSYPHIRISNQSHSETQAR